MSSRNIRIHHLTFVNADHNTQLFSVGRGRNGKNNIQTTRKAIQLLFHDIKFVSEHFELLKHRAGTSEGKPVSIMRKKVKSHTNQGGPRERS